MKISSLRCVPVEIPLDKPIRTAIHDIRSVGCVLVYLDSDEGLSGEAYNFTMNAVRLDVLQAMIESFAPLVVGRDPRDVESIWNDMWRDINFFGQKGIALFGISAIDTACWDLAGKAAEQPLYKIFGACRESVDVYASGGLWLSYSIDELVEEAQGFLEQGFHAMKIRVGKKRIDEDVERVAAVREAIGSEITLMADANQGFDASHALRLGRRLEEFDLYWFEEPVPAWDLAGHAEIAAALDMRIASGETEYTRYGMLDMLEARAADVLMPDLQRIGGLSEFRRVAHLAESYDVPVSTHIFTEQSLSIAGSIESCVYLEHMPWFERLYRERMQLVDGRMAMPHGAGLGFTFDPESVERYRIR